MKNKRNIYAIFVVLIILSSYQVSSISIDKYETLIDQEYDTRNILNSKKTSSIDDEIIHLIEKIDQELIYRYLENLTSFGPRRTGSKACDYAGQYIYNEFVQMGLSTRYQGWNTILGSGTNIEATIPGFDKTNDDVYIICAHYDSFLFSPGADDDASGVAVVMAAAQLMRNNSYRNTIKFVAFSGEERGLLGSRFYVKELTDNNEHVTGVLNVDMVGYAENPSTNTLSVFQNSYLYEEWLTTYTKQIAEEYQDYLNIEIIPTYFPASSDFYSFYKAGFSAICYSNILINYTSYDIKINPYCHTSKDTIDTLNFNYLVKNAKLIILTLVTLADHEFSEKCITISKPNINSLITYYWFISIFKNKIPINIHYSL